MAKRKPTDDTPEPRKRITFESPAQYIRKRPIPKYRLPTPFPFLNDAFGGGLWPGQVYTVQGAPSAGKSSLGVQLAAHAHERGSRIYILASDEGTRAACVRLGQAVGIERDALELAHADAMAALEHAYAPGRMNVVDADAPEALFETFLEQIAENYAADLAHNPDTPPPLLYADSIQAIRTDLDAQFDGSKERIGYIMELAREFTRRTNAMILFVSHVNRQHFAAKKEEDRIDPLAAAAEAIEITRASDVLLDLSGDRKDQFGVKAWLRKNRLHKGAEPIARLRYDFDRGNFTELDPEELKQFEADQVDEKQRLRAEKSQKRKDEQRTNRVERILTLIRRRPGKYNKTKLAKDIGGRKEDILELIENLSDRNGANELYLDDETEMLYPVTVPGAKAAG